MTGTLHIYRKEENQGSLFILLQAFVKIRNTAVIYDFPLNCANFPLLSTLGWPHFGDSTQAAGDIHGKGVANQATKLVPWTK